MSARLATLETMQRAILALALKVLTATLRGRAPAGVSSEDYDFLHALEDLIAKAQPHD